MGRLSIHAWGRVKGAGQWYPLIVRRADLAVYSNHPRLRRGVGGGTYLLKRANAVPRLSRLRLLGSCRLKCEDYNGDILVIRTCPAPGPSNARWINWKLRKEEAPN